ncbi:hypothetical protein BG844_31320 [Couchioplanes caeruleus subsp. caeruleus]|uniref:Uncharacterized protein n=1 Tax=Couchioplanes caeruleus subsp. caeruleus TaxID=56427 RepID=A0A1K0FZT1_9ACTN|nr:hypothetical protein BG844_31320 [Couchioplanes caeruleus subsp. caeruleus]
MDGYRPSPDEQARSDRAQATLERACLTRFGLRWEGPGESALDFGSRSIASERAARFGVVDEDQAARHGYQAPPWSARDPGVRAALTEHHHDTPTELNKVLYGLASQYGGQRVPTGGCRAEAAARLMKGEPSVDRSLPARLEQQAVAASVQDPRLAAVLRAWASCMERAGHRYASPKAAADDPRWKGASTSTEAERAVALADVRCQNKTRYLPTLIDVTAEHQRELISRHATELSRLKRLENTRARNVAEALSAEPTALSPSAEGERDSSA